MPTKISSYLTELGFRQINALGDSISYNLETAGEFLVVKENNRLYRYEKESTQPIDNLNVLNTSDGGNTRWIAVGGAAMTQTRVNYTFEESSNLIPLGQKVLSKANILYINIGNTQILSSEYTLNETKDAIVLPQNFEPGVKCEVVIVIGDFTPEATGLPDQDGQAGKFLTTDGETASWANITIPENVVSAENYTDAKTWKGTLEEYNALEEYSDNTTYIITDDYTESGSGGTSDYNELQNKPSINGIVLEGNKTTADLNLQPAGEYATLENLTTKQDILTEIQLSAVNSGITSEKITTYDNLPKHEIVSILPVEPDLNTFYYIPEE